MLLLTTVGSSTACARVRVARDPVHCQVPDSPRSPARSGPNHARRLDPRPPGNPVRDPRPCPGPGPGARPARPFGRAHLSTLVPILAGRPRPSTLGLAPFRFAGLDRVP